AARRPETNKNGPPRTIADAFTGALGAGSGIGTIVRFKVMVPSSHRCDSIELDLESSLALRRPDRPCRRSVADILPIDPVHQVVFDAVVNQRMHLHQPIER